MDKSTVDWTCGNCYIDSTPGSAMWAGHCEGKSRKPKRTHRRLVAAGMAGGDKRARNRAISKKHLPKLKEIQKSLQKAPVPKQTGAKGRGPKAKL
jgi:hypothetical protein